MKQGRLIDIPYATSPPLLFTYVQTAALAAGVYNFGGGSGTITKAPFTPARPILQNVLYIFQTVSFAMDIDVSDYEAAIATTPQFSAYTLQSGATPLFREALTLPNYLVNQPYTLSLIGASTTGASYPGAVAPSGGLTASTVNQLLGAITGVLNATANLAGKASIKAIVTLSAQEISDHSFVDDFRATMEKTATKDGSHLYV